MSNVISLVAKNQEKLTEINESFLDHINDKQNINLKAYLIITIDTDGNTNYDEAWISNESGYALLGALEVVKDTIINDDFKDD